MRSARLCSVSGTATARRRSLHHTRHCPRPARAGRIFRPRRFTETSAGSGLFSLSANAFDWYANARGTEDADVAKWGWYVDLPRSRERVIYDMMLYGEGLVLTSVRTTEDACSSDISNTLYAIDARSTAKPSTWCSTWMGMGASRVRTMWAENRSTASTRPWAGRALAQGRSMARTEKGPGNQQRRRYRAPKLAPPAAQRVPCAMTASRYQHTGLHPFPTDQGALRA